MVRQKRVLLHLTQKWYGNCRAVCTDGAAHDMQALVQSFGCISLKAKHGPNECHLFYLFSYFGNMVVTPGECSARIICCNSMIYHKLLLPNHCVPTCYDGYNILLLYVFVVYCHVFKSY